MYFSWHFINKLFRLGFLLTLALILMDLLTFFYYPNTILGEIFLATREQTPLTWVSSIILLLIGFSSVSTYLKTKNRIWYFLSLVFLFFSMDDATYFHERISGAIQEIFLPLVSFPSYSWVVLYFPLLISGLGGLLLMLWKDASIKDKKVMLLAVTLLGISVALDMLDGFIGKSSVLVFCFNLSCNSSTTHILRLLEEVLEILGFGVLAYLNIREHIIEK